MNVHCLFLSFPQKKGPHFVLGSAYRPPEQNPNIFNEDFNMLLSELTKKSNAIHIAGDFNIDLFKYLSHNPTKSFVDCITVHHMLPTITRPTRITASTSTLIDNILTTTPACVLDSVIIASDISDHLH